MRPKVLAMAIAGIPPTAQATAAAATRVLVGCAGWSIPRIAAADFQSTGSHLARYADKLPAVEINSSFYRPHRPATYARWTAAVPRSFRFAVKMPKEITHRRRLCDVAAPLDSFLAECGELGEQVGPGARPIAAEPAIRPRDSALLRPTITPALCRRSGLRAAAPELVWR